MEVNAVGANQCHLQVVKTSVMKTAPVGPESIPLNRQALVEEQQKDPSLAYALKVATCFREDRDVPTGYFVRDGILFRKWRPAAQPANEEWTVHEQVVSPLGYCQEVMQLAHYTSLGGHLDTKKTLERISLHFYWPSIRKDVQRFCRSCHACQVVGKPGRAPPVAPLQPLPVEHEPFSHIMIDCVGPLPKTK